MELEFDKEIDAILRKARGGGGTSVNAGHLDADTIAAYAENALPASGRVLYTEHLADCGRCRKQLSHAIAMNREAVAAAASTPWPPVEKAVPWYAKLFQVRNLAVAMGALVLVFSGVLGFMVLKRQNEMAANNAIVSQAPEPEAGRGPYFSESVPANANTATAAANTSAAPQNAAVPGMMGSASNTAPSAATGDAGKTTVAEESSLDDRKAFAIDGASGGAPEPKPMAPAAAAPPPADQPKTEGYRGNEDKLAAGRDEKEKDVATTTSRESRSRMDRDAVSESLKKSGPTRAGPLNNAQQQNSNIYDMSVTRSVGGKTFANRNGAWYDTMYAGQSVKMVRRGSDDFKKLDSGLRNIANELYGTVIVVWKGKAYRIN